MFNKNSLSSNELMHYGILGMKWGIRRAKRSTDSNGLARASKRYGKKYLEDLCIMWSDWHLKAKV